MKKIKEMKGQIFSMDFIAAVFVFVMLFIILLAAWNSTIESSVKNSERKDMELYASRIADFFVSGGGRPWNWIDTPANVSTIGLAKTDRVIDSERLGRFIAMDYQSLKEKLKISGYNFYFRLVNAGIQKGNYSDTELVAAAKRAVIYQGRPDILEFYVWRYR